MQTFLNNAKALADSSRVRVLCALRENELCVCQIVELLGLATSTVSKHMSILRQAGLVASRKEGRWVYYRRPDAGAPAVTRSALAWCDASLKGSPTLSDDEAHLEKILLTPLQELC